MVQRGKKGGEGAAGRVLRRLSHVALGAIVIVYLFPEKIYSLPRELYIVLFFTVLPLTIEYIRLKRGVIFLGLREHERGRVASYAWFCQGVVIAILFFPQEVAAPVIMAAAVVDPLMGELRRVSRSGSLLGGFILGAVVFLLYGYSSPLSLLSGAFVVLGELVEFQGVLRLRPDSLPGGKARDVPFKTDDDFTTVLLPAILLSILYYFLPAIFPGAPLHPSPPFTSLP